MTSPVTSVVDYQPFLQLLERHGLNHWSNDLAKHISNMINPKNHGDIPRWQNALSELPQIRNISFDLNCDRLKIGDTENLSAEQQILLTEALKKLHPWRKGPFDFFGTHIDTEWRSDWKWQRLAPHIADLSGRKVLDVGCGSGYHCWRMRGAGAELVIGIEPTLLFIHQFFAVQKYVQDSHVGVLPLRMEEMPEKMAFFDSVFSMGILYHRRSPFDHLQELRDTLRPGGELILETLIIDGEDGQVLVPQDRYAMMNNVWFLPSVPTLINWVKKIGFDNVRCVDINTTSLDEQRSTEWMRFQSLKDYLDPNDLSKTAEGYPAPKRAIIIAEKTTQK
jgi:tRNA (mo5U34)-methyltransferase